MLSDVDLLRCRRRTEAVEKSAAPADRYGIREVGRLVLGAFCLGGAAVEEDGQLLIPVYVGDEPAAARAPLG